MQGVQSLLELSPDALPAPDAQPYRRAQLAAWLYQRGALSWEAMTNLPRAWRAELGARYRLSPFVRLERFVSADASVRYLLTLPDGKQTEAVYMPYRGRKTLCVSSMVGCPAGCAFCATGALGFGRNLSRAEILGQLLVVAQAEGIAPREIRNVVLMGMGEALLNYDNALGAIRTMIHPEGLDMSPRRITLSTVGLPGRIRRLAAERLPLVLAVSLHAPDEKTRREIIPTAHAHAIEEIIAALHDWQAAGGRRVTIEYTMLAGVNDALWQAEALVALLRGLVVHVNLIPFNPWGASPFRSSSRAQIARFERVLTGAGLSVSVRFSRGRDTGGACGQLALSGEGALASSGL
ncbi:23S rRNA (adenine(2503)-C(2))-methyltransferase RlmN [Truepera radiovictrix]|uniref:Probable dual-specificity RNA methyltransferase RlmN n=1 Tax=Truepera radiovictrix (strain DSM 17093 / CIP 108686 / LMG 22925 / RQ-24) TaxID=649638 RepID=D7CV06_TRURR|nr:23S rRNA (adenine(2503)-C(2))-methyltransferase RlmN [Truepera radiovictrix]ADI15833.1 radical SAM enzyme, Cfr family [Truepera radiovictrix DSM 17093]WMT58540.1 23S rRNA (adenine(2503)-C(2))-methyltransferase RlmN [Truepera radiovictrix]